MRPHPSSAPPNAARAAASPAASPPEVSSGAAAFTLIELLGVLLIIVLLSSTVIRSAIATIKRQQRVAEDTCLDTLSGALVNSIRRTRTVPSTNTWIGALTTEVSMNALSIAGTPLGGPRRLLVDPAFTLGPTGGPSVLPYVQSGSGSAAPANVRMILISSLETPLPALGSSHFEALWNTDPGALPTNWPSGWSGQSEEVAWRRLDLSTLFRRLVLSNLTRTNGALWAIEGSTNQLSFAPGALVETWLVDGTAVTFYNAPSTIAFRDMIRTDISYVRERSGWRHLLFSGPPTSESCGPFADLVDAFLAAPLNPGSPKSNQQTVVDAMFHYLEAFTFWSAESGCDNSLRWFTAQNQVATFSANFDSSAKFLGQ